MENNKQTILKMKENDRLPHSFLFFGEKGWGKTAFAIFTAQTILSDENPKLIAENKHPDVIWVEHSGKLGGFSVETIRNVCAEAFIKPNNGNAKIYIFDDADNITVQAQNALLKLVEEPPDTVYFIFTAKSRTVFLPTMLSRMTAMGMTKPQNSATELTPEVKTLVNCVLTGREYDFLVCISKPDNKDSFQQLLQDFDTALITSFESNGALKIHNAIRKAYFQLNSNVGIKLVGTALTANIFA
jgi:DNA polymerase III delta prime subunit